MRSLRGRTRRLEQSLRSTLARNYPTLKRSGIDSPAPEMEPASLYQFESGCHSQNGEDGCLLEILQRTGFEDGRIVEIGCGAGVESNAALLVCEFGWQGYLIDANADQIEKAEQFYDSENAGDRVKFRHGMVTPDNAESMLKDLLEGETADVISIDVDGWDFWIWQSLKKFKPAVFVIEVNASFGPDVSVTVPYEGSTAGHDPFRHEFRGWHHGASLKALTALGSSLGYRLVHVESTGTNAFYVRRDLMGDSLLAADPAQVWRPHQFRSRRHTPEAQASTLARTPGVEIRGDGAPRL